MPFGLDTGDGGCIGSDIRCVGCNVGLHRFNSVAVHHAVAQLACFEVLFQGLFDVCGVVVGIQGVREFVFIDISG